MEAKKKETRAEALQKAIQYFEQLKERFEKDDDNQADATLLLDPDNQLTVVERTLEHKPVKTVEEWKKMVIESIGNQIASLQKNLKMEIWYSNLPKGIAVLHSE